MCALVLAVALSSEASADPSGRTAHQAGDGRSIPIQREWVIAPDPASLASTPLERRPWRFDQRAPVLVHTESRQGASPVYYFRDVRWRQNQRRENNREIRSSYFTTARVDPDRIRCAWLCLKPFAPRWLAAHAAILLEMEPGGFTNLDAEEGGGIVISYEALMRAGQKYSLVEGQQGKYPVVYVAGTWDDFVFKSVRLDSSVVKRWKLALSPAELRNLEMAVGRTALADHSGEKYNTLNHSCVTAVVDLINQAVPENRRLRKGWLGTPIPNPSWMLPTLLDRSLRRKGLIVGEMEEFSTYPPAPRVSPALSEDREED